jgi:hypothetical protein
MAFVDEGAAPSQVVAQATTQQPPGPTIQLPTCQRPSPQDRSTTTTPPPDIPRDGNGRLQLAGRACDARSFGTPTTTVKQPARPRQGPAVAASQGAMVQAAIAQQGQSQANIGVYEFETNVFGISAGRTISDIGVQPDDNTPYMTMHIGCCYWLGDGDWLEIGWREFADNTRRVFTATRDRPYIIDHTAYPIFPGNTIWLMITADCTCSTWYGAYIWWNNIWQRIDYQQLDAAFSGDGNIVIEMFTGDANWPTLPATTQTNDAKLEQCSATTCIWNNWTPSAAGSTLYGADAPYHIGFQIELYRWWYGYGP